MELQQEYGMADLVNVLNRVFLFLTELGVVAGDRGLNNIYVPADRFFNNNQETVEWRPNAGTGPRGIPFIVANCGYLASNALFWLQASPNKPASFKLLSVQDLGDTVIDIEGYEDRTPHCMQCKWLLNGWHHSMTMPRHQYRGRDSFVGISGNKIC